MTTGEVCEPGGKNYCSYVGGENVRECEGLSLTFPQSSPQFSESRFPKLETRAQLASGRKDRNLFPEFMVVSKIREVMQKERW